jgi:hypothetical protein
MATDSEEASKYIVNAVVDAYFAFIREVARQTDHNMISNLQVERRRQLQQGRSNYKRPFAKEQGRGMN